MKQFFYLTERGKILFSDIAKADVEKDKGAERVLTTSPQNTTYQVVSTEFKKQLPSDIFANLNNQLYSTFKKESKEYFSGKRSLRSYKRNIPMPFSFSSMRNFTPNEDNRNFNFDIFGLKMRTHFGRDLSGNRTIFERGLSGEYKFCNSSIQLDGKKIFLLAVFQFKSEAITLDKSKTIYASLTPKFPIQLTSGTKTFYIGEKNEYLHGRRAIQASLRNAQKAASFTSGGKGRNKKMKSIEHYNKKESNYISTKQHQYTSKMIDYCIETKSGNLILQMTPEPPDFSDMTREEASAWKNENQILLRNWGYRGLLEKIQYKAKIAGIAVQIEKDK